MFVLVLAKDITVNKYSTYILYGHFCCNCTTCGLKATYDSKFCTLYLLLMHLSMVCPRMEGGATPRNLTFKLSPWEGILTIKYLLICTNYKGLCENLTSGEHSREGNLRFSSQKSQIPWGCPHTHTHTPWGKPFIGALLQYKKPELS